MAETPEPEKLASGKFAVYKTPSGGLHLALHVDGETEPRHAEIPPMMLKLLSMKYGKNPFGDNGEGVSRVMDDATREVPRIIDGTVVE